VNPPAPIQAFDPLCEVQSDKASVEITSPFDGVVKELLVKEGAVAKVGEGLCLIEVEEEDGGAAAKADLEKVVEPVGGNAEQAKPTKAESETPAPTQTRKPHPLDPSHPPPSLSNTNTTTTNILAPPSIRHLARKHNIDLALLAPGSGKDGRIEKGDIEA
jgi:2-oxoisovalerate dehydrogenase E2 component (dihydrolipoyl transacylase)